MARVKAENALLPVYRKELRKVLLRNVQWMRTMKKDPTFNGGRWKPKKRLKTQKDLIGWNRQSLLSISENSYSIDCTKSSPFHKIKTRLTVNVIEFFFLNLCIVAVNKNCKQLNFKCVLLMTSKPFIYLECFMKLTN